MRLVLSTEGGGGGGGAAAAGWGSPSSVAGRKQPGRGEE